MEEKPNGKPKNKDIHKLGKKFSKDYQPSNESKRVPKFKTLLKKALKEKGPEIVEAILQKCIEGDIQHIRFIKETVYGREEQKIKHSGGKVVFIPEEMNENRSS